MTTTTQAIDVIRWCRELAKMSESRTETTRRSLTKPMRDVHTALAGRMAQLGMSVRVDAVGNIRGVYAPPSVPPNAPRLFVGSHLDTVPNAGAFDGVLGVVMGIALVEMMRHERLPFGIEVIGFSDEEGIRFEAPFIGSRAFAGSFDPSLLERRDAQGRTLRDAIRDFGLDPARIPDIQAPPHAVGYLEFHIEQGPVLENVNLPLAVVDVIAGQTRASVTFEGMAGHAGTTPMKLRKDALAAAAEWMVAVEREAQQAPALVATVGRIDVEPGAGNVIPGRCQLSLDVRHASDATRTQAADRLRASAGEIAERRGVRVDWTPQLDQASVPMDARLASLLDRAVEQAGFPVHRLPSGAGHDAMIVAGRMPAAMLFVRCEKGLSHHPAENVRDDDVAAALEAGRRFLENLARAPHA